MSETEPVEHDISFFVARPTLWLGAYLKRFPTMALHYHLIRAIC